MQLTEKMTKSYWLNEFKTDISKCNKQIDYYKKLMDSENNQHKPRLKKIYAWNGEIKHLIILSESRKKAIDRINNK